MDPEGKKISLSFQVLRQVLGSDTDGDYCFTEEVCYLCEKPSILICNFQGEFQPFFYEISQITSLRVNNLFKPIWRASEIFNPTS